MPKIVGFALSVALLAGTPSLASGPPPSPRPADALWQKAVEVARKAKDSGMVPGKLEMRGLVKKKDGAVESDSLIVFRIVREGEESRTEILSATENGKDVTAEAKEEEAKQRRKEKGAKKGKGKEESSVSLEPGYHPFAPDIQDRVTCRRVNDDILSGTKVAVYRFRQAAKTGSDALEGRAWLDPETGVPLQVEVSPDPLPKHVDSMKSTVRFEVPADGQWRPTTTDIRGEGGMLMIRRSFESTFRFLDWQAEKAGSTKAP